MAKYIIFSKPTCPFCIKAIELLEEQGYGYETINFDESQQQILNEIKHAYEWKTVPMIFKREKENLVFIGGYSDLVLFLEQGRI